MAARGGFLTWHTHKFDELCLIDETPTTIGHAGKKYPAKVGSLFLFRRGEPHGYWNAPNESPRLWVVHYHPEPALYKSLPGLTAADPLKRIWQLSPEQIEAFQAMHLKLSIERTLSRVAGGAAESAWLRLLLVAVARWRETDTPVTPKLADQDLLRMWQIIHDYTGEPAALSGHLKRQIVNYDSLRHRFSKMTGESPTRLWSRLRLDKARNLLLESSLSVKEIAERVGFARQHEFARAFSKQFGVSPTQWRKGASS